MQANSEIARPYAIAAFKQAQEEGRLAEWSEMLSLLSRIVDDPQMRQLIESPKVSTDELVGMVIEIAGDGLAETGQNFLKTLAEYRRLSEVGSIARQFELERARLEGRSEVRVTSAFELNDSHRESIVEAMKKRLGTEVDLVIDVDDSLIGGVVIRAGDLIIDASVKGRLDQLRQALA